MLTTRLVMSLNHHCIDAQIKVNHRIVSMFSSMSSSLLVILSFEMFCIFSAACDGKGWGQGSSGEQLVRGCQTSVTEVSRCYKTQGPYSDSQGDFNCGLSSHSDLKCANPYTIVLAPVPHWPPSLTLSLTWGSPLFWPFRAIPTSL